MSLLNQRKSLPSRSLPLKTKKLSKKDRSGIVDVPLSKTLSQGSKASLGSMNYHYQKYYNTFAFLKEIYWGEGVTLHNPSSESRTDETPGGLSPSS